MSEVNTNVKPISEEELTELIGTGGATMMTAGEDDKEKPSFFSHEKEPVTAFLDTPKGEDKPTDDPADPAPADPADPVEPAADPAPVDPEPVDPNEDPLAFLEEKPKGEKGEDDKNVGGRPTNLQSLTSKLVEDGYFQLFEGEEDLSKYKGEDYEELFLQNLKTLEEKTLAKTQEAFFHSLPVELQQAYTYTANGGTDIKGLLSSLSASTEIKELDTSTELGQETVVRSWLQVTEFGTPEEIEAEIAGLKDREELEKKANQFHPKLKSKQDAVVQQRLAYQEQQQQLRQEQSKKYAQSIYDVLKPGDLDGIKLTAKQQDLIFSGLTQANYPSAQGGQTNALGHHLEKIQWVEPNHKLLAEVLLLLEDRDAYHKQIREAAIKETNIETVRTLKSAASEKTGSSSSVEQVDDHTGDRKKPVVQRPKKSFFSPK